MTRFALLLLVGCSAGPVDDAQRGHRGSAAIPSTSAVTAIRPVLTGGHGASIEAIAVADDGTCALTQDAFGGTRLWPTLDGRREPVVVTLLQATDLALAHDADGFTLAARDAVGGLEIMRVARDGHVRSRARIAPEPVIEQLAIGAQGVLAARADQTLDIYDATGTHRAHLTPPAGSRIKSIIVRHDHTLVIVERATGFYGRWLADAAWGDETQPLPLDPTMSAVLSPDGKKLAVGYASYVSLVDPFAATPTLVGISDDVGRVDGDPVGFVDNDTLLVANSSRQIGWITLDGRRKPSTITADLLAIGDGRAVSAKKDALELSTLEQTQYLGYGISSMKRVAFHDQAFAIGFKESQPRMLDGRLDVGRALALPDDPRELADAMRLDDGNVLALHALAGWYTISIVDPRTKQTVQSLSQAVPTGRLLFEPATQLLVVSDTSAIFLVQRDKATGRFETWYRVDSDPLATDVYLTDPAKAGGAVAVVVRGPKSSTKSYANTTIRVLERKDLVVGTPLVGRLVLDLKQSVRYVDPVGHAFAVADDNLVEYAAGRPIATYPGAANGTFVQSPDRTYLATVRDSRVALYKAGGTLVWQVAAPLVTDLWWIDGNLVGVFGGGLAKLDLVTGAFERRACGWSFGLGTFPPHEPSEGQSICDAR